MAVRIRTSDGSAYVVDGAFAEVQKKIEDAIVERHPFIKVRNGNGELRSVNATLITSLEETSEEALTPGEERILQAAREAEPQS